MGAGDHIPEDTLELYSMGRLPEVEVSRVEEHVLVCEVCRQELQATDEFIAALRKSLREDDPST